MSKSILQSTAKQMHDELASNRLEVLLIPAPDPQHQNHMIRAVAAQNPVWYQQLCAMYPSGRTNPRNRKKPDTAIKRAHTLRALQELSTGRCETEYAWRILPLVMKRAGLWTYQPINLEEIPF